MTYLNGEFESQRRREFMRAFRASHPEIFGALAPDDASERAKSIAKLDELSAKFREKRCEPLKRLPVRHDGDGSR